MSPDIPEQERCVSCGQVFQIFVPRLALANGETAAPIFAGWEPHPLNFCPACGARQPVAVMWR